MITTLNNIIPMIRKGYRAEIQLKDLLKIIKFIKWQRTEF